MVFLGFGKYARADKIYALEPLPGDERGSGRRTRVWVEGIAEPIVASRTERTHPRRHGRDAPARERAARRGARPRPAARRGRRPRPRRSDRLSAAAPAACSSPPPPSPTRSSDLSSEPPVRPGGEPPIEPERPGVTGGCGVRRSIRRRSGISRDFRRLWFGQAISSIGSQITSVALPFQVYHLTGSTFLTSGCSASSSSCRS